MPNTFRVVGALNCAFNPGRIEHLRNIEIFPQALRLGGGVLKRRCHRAQAETPRVNEEEKGPRCLLFSINFCFSWRAHGWWDESHDWDNIIVKRDASCLEDVAFVYIE